MIGGYKIIDLMNKNLISDGEAITIKGLYESIEHSYRKPLLLSNIVIDGVEKSARYVAFQHALNEYRVIVDGKMLHINNDDLVTYTTSLA